MKDVKRDDKNLVKALKLGKRCLEKDEIMIEKDEIMEPPTKVQFRQARGGRKKASQKFTKLCMIVLLTSVTF